LEDYDAQARLAHAGRDGGRRWPAEVLGFASGVRHREEELGRVYFSSVADFVTGFDGPGADPKNAYIPPLPKAAPGGSSRSPVGSSRLRFIPNALAASSQSLLS
jgi:hypothetical protein